MRIGRLIEVNAYPRNMKIFLQPSFSYHIYFHILQAVAWIYTWGMSFGHGPTTYLGTQNGKHVNSWLSSQYPPDVSANAADSTTGRFFLIKL